ncbi:MAG TPA: DUF2892 domain-containing protein [Chitinophagales bacterium]|nr:DUF2892 domain-containing protein [Chitinophagales bacterium]
MRKNIGSPDKIIRITIAAIIVVLFFTGTINGTLAIVLLVIAAALVLTSFISFCPLYAMLGINSCPIEENKKEHTL